MEYACVVWDPYTHKSVKALEQVQAFTRKMVSHRWDAGYEELLELLNIPSLQERRIHLKLGLLYKIIHGLCYFPDEVFTFRPNLATQQDYESTDTTTAICSYFIIHSYLTLSHCGTHCHIAKLLLPH